MSSIVGTHSFSRATTVVRQISILCWNINRVCTKLEKTNVYNMLCEYDIISLSETKTCLPVRLPGYVTYQGKSLGSDDRGGVVVMVKNYLSNFVCDIDVGIADHVWLQFSNVEEILFGFLLCSSE